MDVGVVIVTYRSASTVAACLRSLDDAATERTLQAVVVDNASDDESAAVVREVAGTMRTPVELVERATNDGFAVGCNTGLARVDAPWVLFLNPDTVCPPGSIDALVASADAHPEAGIVAPALVGTDGELQPTVERVYRLGRYLLGLARIGGANRPTAPPSHGGPVSVPWVHAAAILMPSALARAIGGFDERFFLYMEDMDLCARVRATGKEVMVDPSVRVRHIGGASAAVSGGDPVTAGRRVGGLARFLEVHQGRWAAFVFGAATTLSAGGVAAAQTVLRRPAARHRAMAVAGARVVAGLGRASSGT